VEQVERCRDDVGREEDRPVLAGQVGEEVPEADALLGIEPDRRFVDDHDFRVSEQAMGDPEPALHPARELVGPAVAGVEEADALEDGVDGRGAGLPGADPFQPGGIIQEFPGGELGEG
jgi:hypothetical protein